jgi:hypothetical protein
MGDMRNEYRILVRKSEGRGHYKEGKDGKTILKWVLNN